MKNNKNDNGFSLSSTYSDPYALEKAMYAIEEFLIMNKDHEKLFRVRDMIEAVNPKLYAGFTRGDKSRIGKDFSTLLNMGKLPLFERGKKKGATNTYRCD